MCLMLSHSDWPELGHSQVSTKYKGDIVMIESCVEKLSNYSSTEVILALYKALKCI